MADIHPYNYPPPFTSVLLTECRPAWEPWKQGIYQVILALTMYLAPVVLMVLTYTHIALVLWLHNIPGDSVQGELGGGGVLRSGNESQSDLLLLWKHRSQRTQRWW